MNSKALVALIFLTTLVTLSGCGKKKAVVVEPTPTVATSSESPPAPPAQPSPADDERTRKMALLDYATMEDRYMNDPHAQWASSASASSTFGDNDGAKPMDVSLAANVVGPIDGRAWTNNRQDVGFDWLQVGFDKPVMATEVRVVFVGGDGVEAVNKIEVQDAKDQWVTVWSGLSDVKPDQRGSRTWFVRTFDKTATPTKAVKITIANAVQRGYKVVDAVQLVGE